MDISQIEDIVGGLNQDIYEQIECDYTYLEVSSNSYCIVIEFLGEQIWSSEDDEREFVDEENDVYESLYGFLVRKIKQKIELLSRIKL